MLVLQDMALSIRYDLRGWARILVGYPPWNSKSPWKLMLGRQHAFPFGVPAYCQGLLVLLASGSDWSWVDWSLELGWGQVVCEKTKKWGEGTIWPSFFGFFWFGQQAGTLPETNSKSPWGDHLTFCSRSCIGNHEMGPVVIWVKEGMKYYAVIYCVCLFNKPFQRSCREVAMRVFRFSTTVNCTKLSILG